MRLLGGDRKDRRIEQFGELIHAKVLAVEIDADAYLAQEAITIALCGTAPAFDHSDLRARIADNSFTEDPDAAEQTNERRITDRGRMNRRR